MNYFLAAAKDAGGPCLELGVGTGRVALALAGNGLDVVGIDVSTGMLDVAREKLAQETTEVRERVTLVEADMRSFDLGEEFGFIYSPGGGFQECLTQEDRKGCLESVQNHMRPRGRLALALWLPSLDRAYGILRPENPRVLPDGRSVIRSIVWHEAREDEFPMIDIFYQVYSGRRLEGELQVSSVVNIVDPQQLRQALTGGGLDILEEYGDFAMHRYEPGDEWMVVLARRSI